MRAMWLAVWVAGLAVIAEGCGGGGGECVRDGECEAGELCVADPTDAPADLEPLSLSCDAPLDGMVPASTCRLGSQCDHGICLLAGTCAAPCEVDADCAQGWRCLEAYARTGPLALQPADVCVQAVRAPSQVTVEHRRIADGLAGALSGDAVTFGAGRLSSAGLTAVFEPGRPVDAFASRLATRDADPVLLFDPSGSELVKRNPPSPLGEPITVLVPNGPDSAPTDAGYEMRIRARTGEDGPTDLTVTELARSDPGTIVDLDLFYVGVEAPDSSDAPLPPYVQEALVRVDEVLAPSGVQVGEVRQHLVVGELRQELDVIRFGQEEGEPGDLVELPRLFRLSAGVGRPSVPVFLVRLVERALGISGGVPGPHGVHGTGGSGIAVSVGPIRLGVGEDGGLDLGRVLAHELGHFLGLFHTTEQDGFSLEPLPDTPECPIEQDADGDDVLNGEECEGFDAGNLMFWAASGEALSPEQAAVLGRGAVLR